MEPKNLVRKRGVVKSKLTCFKRFLEKNEGVFIQENVDRTLILELQGRFEKFNLLLDEFEEIQSEIELSCENVDNELVERENFESSFFELQSICKEILERFGSSNNDGDGSEKSEKCYVKCCSKNSEGFSGQKMLPKLPAISIPKFTGSAENWIEFRDIFVSLIHENENLSDIEKYHYLKSALDGNAKQAIGSLEFSTAAYSVAWETLCERYNNTSLLVNSNLKLLVDFPQISKENSLEIRKMLDVIVKVLRSLNVLGVNTDSWDVMVIFLASGKLDTVSKRKWEEIKRKSKLPTLEEFKIFLRERAELLESVEGSSGKCKEVKFEVKSKPKYLQKSYVAVNQKCSFCEGSHFVENCGDFLKIKPYDRFQFLLKNKLCLNCLKCNHISKNCSQDGCKKCGAMHHTLLHYEKVPKKNIGNGGGTSGGTLNLAPNAKVSGNSSKIPEESCSKVMSAYNGGGCKEILLSTVVVQVADKNGLFHSCRVLLDAGSQSNLITEAKCKLLGLETVDVNVSLLSFNQVSSCISKKCVVKLKSFHTSFECLLSCLVVPKIGDNVPNRQVDLSGVEIPRNLKLGDPKWWKPGDIDLLIGAELFYSLLCIGRISLGENRPLIQKTKLGWVLAGGIMMQDSPRQICNLATVDIGHQLEKFWEVEEPPSSVVSEMSEEDRWCEKIFCETTKRSAEDGKFVVTVPLCSSVASLGESKQGAKNKFFSLEKRFVKNPKLKDMYVQFMEEYKSLGHMSLVSGSCDENSYYLPHHGVLNEKSTTTKLRVVFNGSAPTDTGVSFNDIQCKGPCLQDELVDILLRFRQYNVVMCADIEKMYRMIWVAPEQRSLQKIFWRKDECNKLCEYTLNTVTYGTKSAPYLAIRSLKQLGLDNLEKFPEASEVILHNFYVDDMLAGGSTVEETVSLCLQVDAILKSAGLNLRKWISNSSEAVGRIQSVPTEKTNIVFGEKDTNKTLGLLWSVEKDCLLYSVNFSESDESKVTKRTMLSDVARVFDPLGLLSPCLVLVKIMLQQLWSLKLSWDECLPSELAQKWIQLRRQFMKLNDIKIKRQVVCTNPRKVQLHGFCDASKDAYGACVYMRSVDDNGTVVVRLLASKSRVSPLKTLTIPRLELCGALVLAQLVHKIRKSMTINIDENWLWTDSTVVLTWIGTPPHLLQTFVSNRVVQIQELTQEMKWNHVRSEHNPADVVSRGCSPDKIADESKWWNGPVWLGLDESEWDISKVEMLSIIPEAKSEKNSQSFHVAMNVNLVDWDRFSSHTKLVRCMAYCLRFVNNLKSKIKKCDCLSADELEAANIQLVRMVQQEAFSQEIDMLKKCKKLKSSKLVGLTPFVDAVGILRVGGRLQLSGLEWDACHQILLPAKHQYTLLLFLETHKRLLHGGPQLLLSTVREKYWPIGGRNLARKVVRSCIRCFRVNPSQSTQIMGELPELRVKPSPPFFSVGVDYAGPVTLKTRDGRGCKLIKAYVAVFVCFSTKSMHLELVTDLTSTAFIACFVRFISRRGKPRYVWSDNGTSFVGANREMKELGAFLNERSSELREHFENEGISWKFIPARSPNFGGLWEAGVKSCKHHLKRVMGLNILTYESFYTLLTQVEAVLNSRPLVPISTDPNDLDVLTPSHFLIGRRLTTLPDKDYTNVPDNRLGKFKLIQKMYQSFWVRWSKEYLHELQVRTRWQDKSENLKIGQMVVLREDNLPPLRWKLGRILEVVTGPDDKVRVVKVRTQAGVFTRAVSKVCVLPEDVGNSSKVGGMSRPTLRSREVGAETEKAQ